jgi:acyl carrier protein
MTVNEIEIKAALVEIITPFIKTNMLIDSINNETKIIEDLGINSARMVDIILDLEDKFQIQISDEMAAKMTTVGAAVNQVAEIIKTRK